MGVSAQALKNIYHVNIDIYISSNPSRVDSAMYIRRFLFLYDRIDLKD